MGYACPVCGDPQADGHHLANHLAFTAMLDGDEHEAWLDEHAPDWADTDPAELAATVTDRAEEMEYPQVFEDTTDEERHRHDRIHEHGHHTDHDGGLSDRDDGLDDAMPNGRPDPSELFDSDAPERDVENVLTEARELTRRRRENAADAGSADQDGEANEGGIDTKGEQSSDCDGDE